MTNLAERMKKYAGRLYTHEETEMLTDLQTAMRALDVATGTFERLLESQHHGYDPLITEALETIDELLGEK